MFFGALLGATTTLCSCERRQSEQLDTGSLSDWLQKTDPEQVKSADEKLEDKKWKRYVDLQKKADEALQEADPILWGILGRYRPTREELKEHGVDDPDWHPTQKELKEQHAGEPR
jgi:hypothetical protein